MAGDPPKQIVRTSGVSSVNAGDDTALSGSTPSPPQGTLRLWTDVANGIDKSQTVVWKNAVDSLDQACRFLLISEDARRFVESYMKPVISILLEQQPSKIGQMEKNCVEESLRLAVMIVAEDLRSKADVASGECKVLEVLTMVFNRKKTFYKGSKPNFNVNLSGLPEVRMQMISRFKALRGFTALATYLSARVTTPQFPPLEMLHQLLSATAEAIATRGNTSDHISRVRILVEDDSIRIAQAVMDFLGSASEDSLKRLSHESLSNVRLSLQRIFDALAPTRWKDMYDFYGFWRNLALKLITSQSLPLRLFGWDEVGSLIESCEQLRPPPRAFIVSDAGCSFVNGRYEYSGVKTDDGFAVPGAEISYVRKVPDSLPEIEGGGKKLTLFRCTMRSQQKWWFLSEADEEQPGTDKDIDYYQHKSKHHEEGEPPSYGWLTCRNSGKDPPPTLKGEGLMVPPGEEYNTLEHQLAKWAIENEVIELVLGDSVHREVVARSTALIKFLASMCERDETAENEVDSGSANAYCLKASHLLLAWKTCTSKADAAVSAQVYQLLVSILPSLPDNLAKPLLAAIQKSLKDSTGKRDSLNEVAEFCSALATANPAEVDTGNHRNSSRATLPVLPDVVRAEVLELLWAVLTHPDASSLKCYEHLKNYVTSELRVEPMGSTHRETFLASCKQSLSANAQFEKVNSSGDPVDEVVALRMVKLTKFILEACPREQAQVLVAAENAMLPVLLFRELTTYMKRRAASTSSVLLRKHSSTNGLDFDHSSAFAERLNILRYAYGLTERAEMTSRQLDELWALSASPSDLESLMVFMADASTAEINSYIGTPGGGTIVDEAQSSSLTREKQPLIAAFSDDVRIYAFQNLFCSADVNWEQLGEGAYQSFQTLFKSLRRATKTSLTANGPALDALWRICLAAGNDNVASQAMNDLLAVYNAISAMSRQGNTNNAWTHEFGASHATETKTSSVSEESFAKRVFDCLVKVKEGLEAGDPASERSAERCLRILNAAAGQSNAVGRSGGATYIAPLSSVSPDATVADVLRSVPHGMRGQACYRTIGIVAKRTSPHTHGVTSTGTGPLLPSVRDEEGNYHVSAPTVKLPSTVRFTIDVHPLETLTSVKVKVATYCNHPLALVKPVSVSGRQGGVGGRTSAGDSSQMSLSVVPDDSVVGQLGITEGCEVVFLLANHPMPANKNSSNAKNMSKRGPSLDLGEIFSGNGQHESADRFFDTLLAVLEAIPINNHDGRMSLDSQIVDAHKLVWDLLLAMPTNPGIVDSVRSAAHLDSTLTASVGESDAMVVDQSWSMLLNGNSFHRSVYVMQVVDSFLQPAPEILSRLPPEKAAALQTEMNADAVSFRRGFIESGGFSATLQFFTDSGTGQGQRQTNARLRNAFALRILNCCFFGNKSSDAGCNGQEGVSFSLDEAEKDLLMSLSDRKGLLKSLTAVVVDNAGISHAAVMDVLHLLRLLFLSDVRMTEIFASLPNNMGEKFFMTLLLWENNGAVTVATVNATTKIRKGAKELVLMIPALAYFSLPWLIKALDDVDVTSESASEYFAVLRQLVEGDGINHGDVVNKHVPKPSDDHLRDLATAVCRKLASYPRPSGDLASIDFSTGVLCGCLRLLHALIENGGGTVLDEGAQLLVRNLDVPRWSQLKSSRSSKGVLGIISLAFRSKDRGLKAEDASLIDLMGAVFDGFLSSSGACSVAICCDKESRQLGFNVVAAAARSCEGDDGYLTLVTRINSIIGKVAPSIRHRWGQSAVSEELSSRPIAHTSKYSGLRNQGCTCYMNSVLQQLFMMPGLRKNLCSATLPSSLRTSGGGSRMKGSELRGKKISLQWDSGVPYEAIVEAYNEETGTHTVRYCPLQIATVSGVHNSGGMVHHHEQRMLPDASLPEDLPDEFFLSEGRPGKETGVFEIIAGGCVNDSSKGDTSATAGESSQEGSSPEPQGSKGIKETEDESSSRHLLEEVQRTFVHLDEGVRGRCFDPRSLVEACACLKLEFDVWQQNDASEFAMKLLDRLEICLKRWSPSHFRYLEHTFGLKQTKQKICKECGLKTNREEHLMNIDCQIRGKADVHEALSTMCEVEFMEGDNKVFCDRCKKKCDTVLRTAISALPNMLVLSLKRFDLDYNTFETVKLNSRCAFGQTLSMKRYTLEGVEAMEKVKNIEGVVDADSMDTCEDGVDASGKDPLSSLPDEDYEYKLSGVLVHAGVAQGGHYYSFIKDRTDNKWYRFEDEDVTPFDPSSIEVECFGGKVKKETKFANGQVHTVESEQFANALMLFYEKVKPAQHEDSENEKDEGNDQSMDEQEEIEALDMERTSGYDVFQPDVRRSNTTLSWQNFLFDAEFQSFLKGMLGLCLISTMPEGEGESMDVSMPGSSPIFRASKESSSSWRMAVMQMLVSFVFDILFHSADKYALNDWTRKLVDALRVDRESAREFVHELARKTDKVAFNWLRTYLSDCPEEASRLDAIEIIAVALESCASIPEEQNALRDWTQAWKSQVEERGKLLVGKRQHASAMPTKLEGDWAIHEDVSRLSSGSPSSLGIIMSFISLLLELAPRTWRYSADICLLVRELSCLNDEAVGHLLRQAMLEAQMSARLICLATRERSPPLLRTAFPGASISIEIAEALVKTETNPSSHLLPLAGGASAMGSAGVNSPGGNPNMPCAADHQNLIEALACLIGIQGAKRAVLIMEVNDSPKGRPVVVLSDDAREALSIIFHESKSRAVGGMGQRDIQNYMRRCGVDASTVPPQKIVNILNKYPTTMGSNGDRYLSLEGFLAYYCDTAQTNEPQVRLDLHTFGFRPNLTRRSEEARYLFSGERQIPLQTAESVALDVASSVKDTEQANLGPLAETGLLSFCLYVIACNACEPLAEYLLAAAMYGRDTSRLIVDALKELNRAPIGWTGTEIFHSCLMVFKILSALPDDRRQERITALMQSTEKSHPHVEAGVGLLLAAKELSRSRSSQHYSADFHYSGAFERYIEAVKELYKQREVSKWMSDHRSLWSWMEHVDRGSVTPEQIRGDFTLRRDGGNIAAPLNLHLHSDSDMNVGLNESDVDDDVDDDSGYDHVDTYHVRVGKVVVAGAGVAAVNGTYHQNGLFDNVAKYAKVGVYKDREEVFSLFRCPLSDNTRRWYISIVPKKIQPGTNKDIDFYSAPVLPENSFDYPPSNRWTTAKGEGVDPPPLVTCKADTSPDDGDDDETGDGNGQMWNSNEEDVIDDVDDGNHMGYL